MYACRIETPMGLMLAAAKDGKLTGLWFMTQKHFPKEADQWEIKEDYPIFNEVRTWLNDYFEGKKVILNLPTDPQGTDFQKIVWKLLLEIPYGETTTYGDIAKKVALEMDRPTMSAQAVGGAIGRNPISIMIPCHRVIGANKGLTGYDGGLDKKEALLRLESEGTF